jgi:hypothetical protein
MDRYRFHRQDLVVNGTLKNEITLFERGKGRHTRLALGRRAVEIGKIFALCQNEKEFRGYFSYARNQFEILLESDGYNPETLSKIASVQILHCKALECCLYLGDQAGVEHHFSKLLEIIPLQGVKEFSSIPVFFAYLDDMESIECLKNIPVKKKWLDVVGVMKDAMLTLMERDVESFREQVVRHCERVKTLQKKGNWHFFSFFNDIMVPLVLIARMKGIDVKIPHDGIPVFFGGLGCVETYPRIDRENMKKNEFILKDYRNRLSSDVEKQQKDGDFKRVRGYGSRSFEYSQQFEIYEEAHGEPENPLGIRVLKKGNYRFILHSSKSEYLPGKERPTISERKIFFVELSCGNGGKIEKSHTYVVDSTGPTSVEHVINGYTMFR